MLGLKLPTDPRWVNVAEKSIDEILIDHAYCEQKAASACMSLIVSYPEHPKILETLSPIVAEEWQHFEMVIEEMNKRGIQLKEARSDEYAMKLNKLVRKGEGKDTRLLDKLLVCALIEARSCERFRILSENISDEALKEFYRMLMISEAGHYVNFEDLAKTYFPDSVVTQRLDEMLVSEADIMANLDIRGDRVH